MAQIRNIPNKYTQRMLLDEIDLDFLGTYDFFYLPIDFKVTDPRALVFFCFPLASVSFAGQRLSSLAGVVGCVCHRRTSATWATPL